MKKINRQAAPPQLLEWCHLSSAQLLDVAAPIFYRGGAWCVRAPNRYGTEDGERACQVAGVDEGYQG